MLSSCGRVSGKQTENINRLMETDNKPVVSRWKQVEGWAKEMKKIKRNKLPALKEVRPGDIVYSIGNIISNTIITLHSDRW